MKVSDKSNTSTFPPKTVWNVAEVKAAGLYTWFKEISDELPNGWVIVEDQRMLMLGGYSYLGLNHNEEINRTAVNTIGKFGTGMSGSRFLAGTTELHSKLEQKIAYLHNKEDAILFTSGYLANVSTIASLVKRQDYIIGDKMNHASIMDGAKYSPANFIRYRHNDIDHLEIILSQLPPKPRKLVITDSIFSMSGEVVNLPAIIKVCKKYGAILMVDECHSMYVLGETGGGIVEYYDIDPDDIDIVMATLSKAIPASGGYIAANSKTIDYLRHESRGFIYSISLSSVMVSIASKALEIFEANRYSLVQKLHQNTKTFSDALKSHGISVGKSITSIIPIHVGDTTRAARVAKKCQQQGLYIHAVFPPVVPAGKAILRASITASHRKADLIEAAATINRILRSC